MNEYKSLDDLINAGIKQVYEYDGFYYVLVKAREYYDNSIWKVNKKTGEVSYMMFTEFIINVERFATSVDPNELKRAS